MAAEGKKVITVLSIDGGGVRGLIPATILDFLESELKRRDGENARIADYFDFIAGTSTGGLVTAMLTSIDASSQSNLPCTTQQIIKFYHDKSPKIFPHKSEKLKHSELLNKTLEPALNDLVQKMEVNQELYGVQRSFISVPGWVQWMIEKLKGLLQTVLFPKYDGDELKKAIKEKVGDVRLSHTLTNVIIPSFDIKLLQPTVFSTLKARRDDLEDASLVDVCLSTSAAPYFLPLHTFEINALNRSRKFNMVDGGVAANNPTLIALSEVAKEMCADGKVQSLKDIDGNQLLVLSLGTGSSKRNNQLDVLYDNWGPLEWVIGDNGIPIIDVLQTASDDMVDVYLSAFFQGTSFHKNYLRIQTDSLKASEITMDNSNEENLKNLERIGTDLLGKPVSTVDLATGLLIPIHGAGKNEDALKTFADRLSAERKRRMVEAPTGN
ncbi:hypothetical protein REPUB_Repub06bG0042800 [Reevesia pubescens]